MAQAHIGTMSPAPLSAPARGGHQPSTHLGGTSFVACVTAKFSAELDRVALHALRLLLDLFVASIRFVWILPPLEVDPLWKDGVGVEVRFDGVVVLGLEETVTNLRGEIRVPRKDSYWHDRLSCIHLW